MTTKGNIIMPRIFKEMGFNSSLVLSAEDYVRYVDASSKEFVPAKTAPIIKRAEAHLTKEIPILPASVYLDYPRNGNRSRYESIHFARRSMALDLAIAEYCEKQGRFADKLMDVVWAIMEESTWIIPAHLYNSPSHAHYGLGPVYNLDRLHGIDLFSASTSGTLSTVYMLCKDTLDAITPLICEKMEYMLIDRTIKPFINCVFWWTGERGNSVNNWDPWIISNILHTLSVVNVDMYTRKLVVQKCLDSLDNWTALYAPDGGCDEGPSYWGAAGASYFDCLELLYAHLIRAFTPLVCTAVGAADAIAMQLLAAAITSLCHTIFLLFCVDIHFPCTSVKNTNFIIAHCS